MHPKKKEALLQKGWSEEEIKKAEAVLEKTESKDIFFSRITFWSAIVVTIFANLVLSLALIPFLTVFDQWLLYVIIIFLAGSLGFLYNLLITDIGHLEKKHHFLAGLIIPLLTFINLIAVVLIANHFISTLDPTPSLKNSWLLGIVFALAFITPYFINQIRGKHHFYKP